MHRPLDRMHRVSAYQFSQSSARSPFVELSVCPAFYFLNLNNEALFDLSYFFGWS